jgi:predicted Zn-dependent protease
MASVWQDSLAFTSWKVNQDSYLRLVDGIVYGEDPRQGYVEGNTFYHPELRFKYAFPTGWQLENMPAQVNMAPKDGKALMVFTHAPGSTLQEAAWNTLRELELNLQQSRNATVHGMPAMVTVSGQVTQDPYSGEQQAIKVLSYFITYNNANYVFHGVTADADFNAYTRIFESSMASFDKLTDPAKLNVKQKKIIVKSVLKSGTVSEAFKALGVAQNRMNEMALLNNLELTAQVSAGRLVKIVGE